MIGSIHLELIFPILVSIVIGIARSTILVKKIKQEKMSASLILKNLLKNSRKKKCKQ